MNILHNQKLNIRIFLKNDSVVSYILTKELAHSILLNGKKDYKTVTMSPLVLEETLYLCVKSSHEQFWCLICRFPRL